MSSLSNTGSSGAIKTFLFSIESAAKDKVGFIGATVGSSEKTYLRLIYFEKLLSQSRCHMACWIDCRYYEMSNINVKNAVSIPGRQITQTVFGLNNTKNWPYENKICSNFLDLHRVKIQTVIRYLVKFSYIWQA